MSIFGTSSITSLGIKQPQVCAVIRCTFGLRSSLLCIVCGFWSWSCANSFQSIRQNGHLMAEGAVYIAVPRDGVYGGRTYVGSGLTTSQVLLGAFARHALRADVADGVESFEDARQSAQENGYRYVVFPTILWWEDRATEWSGVPDRAEVKLDVFDLSRAARVASTVISARSGRFKLSAAAPQDLLPDPVGEFVTGLYGNGPRRFTSESKSLR